MYNFVQKYFAQIVHFCIDNNKNKKISKKYKKINKKFKKKSINENSKS